MMSLFFYFAESEGFKPPIPGKGIPDFESSAFGHSANFPIADAKVMHFYETTKIILENLPYRRIYSKEILFRRLFSCSASLFRMLSFISQVLS